MKISVMEQVPKSRIRWINVLGWSTWWLRIQSTSLFASYGAGLLPLRSRKMRKAEEQSRLSSKDQQKGAVENSGFLLYQRCTSLTKKSWVCEVKPGWIPNANARLNSSRYYFKLYKHSLNTTNYEKYNLKNVWFVYVMILTGLKPR